MTATCAKCGEQKDLCNSGRIDGIKQPRICKECLLESFNMTNEEFEESLDEIFWLRQMVELNDNESLRIIKNLKDLP